MAVLSGTTVSRAVGKAKRDARRLPLVKQVSQMSYDVRRGRFVDSTPVLDASRQHISCELRDAAIAARDFTALLPPAAVAQADEFVAELRRVESDDASSRISLEDQLRDPLLYMWGLDEANLDLARTYLGLPVRYLGLEFKRERANGCTSDVRQWHMDVEDRRMMKMIVYLNDVDGGGGPFEYLRLADTTRAQARLKYRSGFVTDEQMGATVPRQDWCQAMGPRLSGVFVDTCRLFHRATPPDITDRYSMTYSYSSTTPFQVFPEFLQARGTVQALADRMTPAQRRAAGID